MKTVSVSEAREQLSSIINWATTNQDDVVIQNRGDAKAVLIPYPDYELLKAARENQRKADAIAELKAIAQEVRNRNASMTTDEVEQLADEVSREAVQSLIDKGKVTFEQ